MLSSRLNCASCGLREVGSIGSAHSGLGQCFCSRVESMLPANPLRSGDAFAESPFDPGYCSKNSVCADLQFFWASLARSADRDAGIVHQRLRLLAFPPRTIGPEGL